MFAPTKSQANTPGLFTSIGGALGGSLPSKYRGLGPLIPAALKIGGGLITSPQGLNTSGSLSDFLLGPKSPSLGQTIGSVVPELGIRLGMSSVFKDSQASPYAEAARPLLSHVLGTPLTSIANYALSNVAPSLYGAAAPAVSNASNILPNIISNFANPYSWINPILGVISSLIGRKNPEAGPGLTAASFAAQPIISALQTAGTAGAATAGAATAGTAGSTTGTGLLSGVLSGVTPYLPIIGVVLSALMNIWQSSKAEHAFNRYNRAARRGLMANLEENKGAMQEVLNYQQQAANQRLDLLNSLGISDQALGAAGAETARRYGFGINPSGLTAPETFISDYINRDWYPEDRVKQALLRLYQGTGYTRYSGLPKAGGSPIQTYTDYIDAITKQISPTPSEGAITPEMRTNFEQFWGAGELSELDKQKRSYEEQMYANNYAGGGDYGPAMSPRSFQWGGYGTDEWGNPAQIGIPEFYKPSMETWKEQQFGLAGDPWLRQRISEILKPVDWKAARAPALEEYQQKVKEVSAPFTEQAKLLQDIMNTRTRATQHYFGRQTPQMVKGWEEIEPRTEELEALMPLIQKQLAGVRMGPAMLPEDIRAQLQTLVGKDYPGRLQQAYNNYIEGMYAQKEQEMRAQLAREASTASNWG